MGRPYMKLTRRKNEWGEYVIKFWNEQGKRWKESDYLTDDWEDAVSTFKLIAKNYGLIVVNWEKQLKTKKRTFMLETTDWF